MTAAEWLAAYRALDAEHERVREMKDAAGEGRGSYEEADSAGFDLDEKYTELAHAASDVFAQALFVITRKDVERHAERPLTEEEAALFARTFIHTSVGACIDGWLEGLPTKDEDPHDDDGNRQTPEWKDN